jgi:hypothetical protein
MTEKTVLFLIKQEAFPKPGWFWESLEVQRLFKIGL